MHFKKAVPREVSHGIAGVWRRADGDPAELAGLLARMSQKVSDNIYRAERQLASRAGLDAVLGRAPVPSGSQVTGIAQESASS